MHEWLKSYTPGDYIDIKDSSKTWKVGKITAFSESSLSVSIDTLQDQEFPLSSPNLSPFRKQTSLSPTKVFTLSSSDLKSLTNTFRPLPSTPHDLSQFLRGKVYFAVEFLLDYNFPPELEIVEVFEFFQSFLTCFVEFLSNCCNLFSKHKKVDEDFDSVYVKCWPEVFFTAKRLFGLDPKTSKSLHNLRYVPEGYKYCVLTADKKSALSFFVNFFASIGGFDQILKLVSITE